MRIVQIKPRREEFVSRMALRRRENDAVMRDALTEPGREEYVSRTAQRGSINGAASRGVAPMPKKQDFVRGIATQQTIQPHKQNTMLLLLFHFINQLIVKMRNNLIRGFGDLVHGEFKR
jgi:hypothetical protein